LLQDRLQNETITTVLARRARGDRNYYEVSEELVRYVAMLVAIDQITSAKMPGRKP
jgi:hypothetical protein